MKKDAVMNGTGQAAEPIVRIRGLRKSFGSHVVLSGIDFDVLPSQVVVVIGPSGSGKSTFLRCCNGLEQPEGGTVEICGRTLVQDGRMLPDHDLNALREEVGMVFQSFNLFPHLSVLDNVTLGPRKLRGLSRKEAEERAQALLAKAARVLDEVNAAPIDAASAARASIAVAEAKVLTTEISLQASEKLFELSGSRASRRLDSGPCSTFHCP